MKTDRLLFFVSLSTPGAFLPLLRWMRRLRLYLDSSLWFRLADDTLSERRRVTIRFLNGPCPRHELLTSVLVRKEIGRIRDLEQRAKVRAALAARTGSQVVGVTTAERIAAEVQALGAFGDSRLDDLTHAGYAVFGRADAVVTWDVKTFACESVRQALGRWGRRQGVPAPLIGTPQEVSAWLNL